MFFSIDKTKLQSSLIQLNKVIPTRSTLPIISCVLFDIRKDGIELRATDLEITLSIFVNSEIKETGMIAIPIKTLLDITQELDEGDLSFEITDIGKIIINTHYGKYTIMGKQADEFPAIPTIDQANELLLKSDDLTEMIDNTVYAVSKDEMKPALQGVLLQVKENQLITVATDGHRLVRYIKDQAKGQAFEGQVVMPSKFLSLIRNQLSNIKDLALKISENHVQISFDDTTIYSRIIKQRFPDYESVIPQDNDKKLVVNKNELLSSVKRVSIFSNKSTRQISLSITKDSLTISTEDPENITTGKETIACVYEGEPLLIGYNAQYLKEVLAHQKDDDINVKLKTPVSATIFTHKTKKENIVTLLMPIRIND
ncbi:MAG: DNA polymerase III subunit beta [Candidatus Marinimicrobia bacterium]|nr:DNA polymerase III subunit beta [Candidatus Neomarinimicrobiota bacterium]